MQPDTARRDTAPAQTKVRWLRGALLALTGLVVVAALSALVMAWRVSAAADGRAFEHLQDVPQTPVAIVPGAQANPDGTPTASLEDRLQAAFELYAAGLVEHILVSGDAGAPEYDEVVAMRAWLEARGVPSGVIVSDGAGYRTLDTMFRAAQQYGVERAVICTQRFHLARSIYLARAAGIDAYGFVADRRAYEDEAAWERREALARVLAWLDVNVLGTRPRSSGADGRPSTATQGR